MNKFRLFSFNNKMWKDMSQKYSNRFERAEIPPIEFFFPLAPVGINTPQTTLSFDKLHSTKVLISNSYFGQITECLSTVVLAKSHSPLPINQASNISCLARISLPFIHLNADKPIISGLS